MGIGLRASSALGVSSSSGMKASTSLALRGQCSRDPDSGMRMGAPSTSRFSHRLRPTIRPINGSRVALQTCTVPSGRTRMRGATKPATMPPRNDPFTSKTRLPSASRFRCLRRNRSLPSTGTFTSRSRSPWSSMLNFRSVAGPISRGWPGVNSRLRRIGSGLFSPRLNAAWAVSRVPFGISRSPSRAWLSAPPPLSTVADRSTSISLNVTRARRMSSRVIRPVGSVTLAGAVEAGLSFGLAGESAWPRAVFGAARRSTPAASSNLEFVLECTVLPSLSLLPLADGVPDWG